MSRYRLRCSVRCTSCVDKLRVEINARFPFKRIKGYPDLPKYAVNFKPLKDIETQKILHVQRTVLSVVKSNRKDIVFVSDYAFHCGIH
jgi:hypothetical protein